MAAVSGPRTALPCRACVRVLRASAIRAHVSSCGCLKRRTLKASRLAQDATEPLLVHGTCVAFANGGILLRGAPGSGKSDLALRFIAAYGNGRTDGGGAALVSDDQVQLTRVDDAIVARAPEP